MSCFGVSILYSKKQEIHLLIILSGCYKKITHNLSTIEVAKNYKNINIPSTEELIMYVLKSTSVNHIKFIEDVFCIQKWHL